MKEHVRWNRLTKKWHATNNAYPMVRTYGVSKSNALSRLKLTIERAIEKMKGIHP